MTERRPGRRSIVATPLGRLSALAAAFVQLAAASTLAYAGGAGEGGSAAPALELVFSTHGEASSHRTLADLRAVVPNQRVRVHEPYESGEAEFVALPFVAVLDSVYGEAWRAEEELLFTCSDGYQPTVPVARVLEHRAWLAFDRVDAEAFVIRKRESGEQKIIDLAPFYLIWDNLADERVRQEADYGWPYQLVGVDLIRTRDRFPGMMPPADASPAVSAGFAAFRVHCSKCHQLNGEGGTIGPELNAAVSPVQYRDRKWLHGWIDDPSRLNPGSRMPPLNRQLPDRARVIDEILAYLDAMVQQRVGAGPGSAGGG